jgi:hypothetical protein
MPREEQEPTPSMPSPSKVALNWGSLSSYFEQAD